MSTLKKITLNGLDDFTSNKWDFGSSEVVIIDPQTVELRATTAWKSILYDLSFLTPGETYYVSHDKLNIDAFSAIIDSGWNGLVSQYGGTGYSFIYPANKPMRLQLSCKTAGNYRFGKVMITKGIIPIPYQPKIGERMIMPIIESYKMGLSDNLYPHTSFNPVPTGSRSFNIGVGKFHIQFEAFSPSGPSAVIRIRDTSGVGGQEFDHRPTMTTEWKSYFFEVNSAHIQAFYFHDHNATNDIQVRNLSIVQVMSIPDVVNMLRKSNDVLRVSKRVIQKRR